MCSSDLRRQETVEYRRVNLQAGLRTFQEHPFFGVGYGGFAKKMFEGDVGFDDKALASGNENTWLGILVDLGLIGLFLYVTIFALLIRSNIQVLRRYDGEEELARPFAALALAMVIYTAINANTGDLRFHLYDPCFAFLVQGIAARLAMRDDGLEQIFEQVGRVVVDEPARVSVYEAPVKPA